MKEPRWLVPCNIKGDVRAVEAIVQQACASGATVVAVSLFPVHMDQVNPPEDFLECITRCATRAHVQVECHVIVARKGTLSLRVLVHELSCSSMVLVTDARQGVFLSTDEVRDALLGGSPASLVLIRLADVSQRVWLSRLGHQCLSWLRSWSTHKEENGQTQKVRLPEKECSEQRTVERSQHEQLR